MKRKMILGVMSCLIIIMLIACSGNANQSTSGIRSTQEEYPTDQPTPEPTEPSLGTPYPTYSPLSETYSEYGILIGYPESAKPNKENDEVSAIVSESQDILLLFTLDESRPASDSEMNNHLKEILTGTFQAELTGTPEFGTFTISENIKVDTMVSAVTWNEKNCTIKAYAFKMGEDAYQFAAVRYNSTDMTIYDDMIKTIVPN